MELYSFGDWLKRKRRALDLTQAELASQVGCSAAAIRKLEAEERRPSAQIAERLAEIFHVPQDERANFLRFARGEVRAAPAEAGEEFPWHTTKSSRSNLPARTTSLVGRKKEIADVREYLLSVDIRLVTLSGPPGIGKTLLSLEAARASMADFSDGVFFVALAPLEHPSLIEATIIQALRYPEAKNQPTRQQLLDGIGSKQMLLVLDNCEHLIEEIAPLATILLSNCPRLKILATSREAFRAPGEWIYPVPTLEVPKDTARVNMQSASNFPALALFAERARAVRSDFVINADNIDALVEICNQLDGLPLAIELIAARIRFLSPQSLLERLNDQFILSADGMRAMSPRQKTLSNAIGWSYNLLSKEEQHLFAYLSVFAGGFTLEAAEAIFSKEFIDTSVSNLISSLLDKSLLQRGLDARGEIRFNMLVTIQKFALNCLQSTTHETDARDKHLVYFLELAEKADQEIHGPDQVVWMARLGMELDNFRAALDWGFSSRQMEKLFRLFAALGWNWLVRWSPSEYRQWLDNIRALPDLSNHPATYARILNLAAQQEWLGANFDESRSLAEESQGIWLELGVEGEGGLAETLCWLGLIASSRLNEKDYTIAEFYFEQGFELYRKCGDRWGMAFARLLSGSVANDKDEDTSALVWLNQSLALFRELGDPWGLARIYQRLGELYMKQGSYEEARFYFDEHLKLDEDLDFKEGIAVALTNLGQLCRYQRDYEQAERYFEKSLSICREYSLKIDRGNNLFFFGMLALHRDNYPLAMKFFIDYFDATRRLTGKIAICDFLMGVAAVAGGTNQSERAAKLNGAVQAIYETMDYRVPPFDRAEFHRHIQIARAELGEARFGALASAGRTMTVEQAIAYALESQN
jgi:predicted ATPase/transcriptional regulator with XRE-family HTH domain